MSDLATRPSHTYVDPVVATGHVLLVSVDDGLESAVIRLTPANAYKLAQMLIAAAEAVEMP